MIELTYRRILLCAICLTFAISVIAIPRSFKTIENYSGLPDNSVNAVCQDDRGFLWMGTANGLACYDGLSFNSFRHSDDDIFSLLNNNVHKVLPVCDGLYVITDGGLCFYSYKSGRFLRCFSSRKNSGLALSVSFSSIIDVDGSVFVAGSDGHLYASERGNRTKFVQLQHRQSFSVVARYMGNMFLAAGPKGIYLLSDCGKRIVSSCTINDKPTYKQNLYFSKNTNLAYIGNGIGYESSAYSIVGMRILRTLTEVPSDLMAVTDLDRSTVFGIDGKGIIIKNPDGTFEQYNTGNSNLSNDAVYSLLTDRENNLWVGTYRGGVNLSLANSELLYLQNRRNKGLSYNLVTAITHIGDNLYVGLDGGGLNVCNRKTGEITVYTTANSSIPGDNVLTMSKDKDCLWLGIYTKGLARLSLSDNTFTSFPVPNNSRKELNDVWVIKDDGIGNIWLGGGSLYVFNKATEKASLIRTPGLSDCTSMVVRGDCVWVATARHGLFVYNSKSHRLVNRFTADSKANALPTNNIKYIFFDSKGVLWLSSDFKGLYSINLSTKETTSYNIDNGLTCPNVTSIIEDATGCLWMGTNNGLFRFDKVCKTFMRIDEENVSASVYTYDATYRDGNRIYFGSTSGLLSFNSYLISRRKSYSNVGFLSLELINSDRKKINIYGDHPDDVTLSYNQNFFTIKFSKPEITSPNYVLFSYYLKGFDKEYRTVSNTRSVTYTNVPPGSYDFYVRCTDSHGQWMAPSVLHIVITPPWWRTVWAYLLWAVLLVCVIIVIFRLRLRELNIKHKVQIKEIEKASSDKINTAKIDIYTNIVHELRTPVFLISANIEELITSKAANANVPVSSLYAIQRSSTKLNTLINRIIDFRKMGLGVTKLHLANYDVVELCNSLADDYQNLFEQKEISFTFTSNNSRIMLCFDYDKLTMILSNLLSNAFKYTKDNGSVVFSVIEKSDNVFFSVKDNGIGIVEQMRDTIFESFFRTERGEKQSEGDGMGLSVVKSFVELHGGFIECRSEVDKGAEFCFNIPKRDIDDVQPAAQQPEPEPESVVIGNPMAIHTILLIDDNNETLDLLGKSLQADFNVIKAHDGEEGFRFASEQNPDVIVCDIMMPNMDGLQLIDKLKKDPHLSQIDIIILTAKTLDEDMIKAFDMGIDAYLTKPISLKLLRKRIDLLLSKEEEKNIVNVIKGVKKTYTKEEQMFLVRCREIIDSNLENDAFNIDFLADKLAMSHSSLYKKIKTMTDMSLIDFINEYKIYKAVQMFNSGVTNVETVYIKCGFRDAKNFRMMFKRKMNMSPKQYVESL